MIQQAGSMNNTTEPNSFDNVAICAWTLIPTVFVIIFVIGLVGNLFVLITVLTNKQMRSTTNILILNLATADLLFIVMCVPFTGIAYLVPLWPFGQFLCRLHQYLLHVTAHASVYTLVFMSFDRYLAVVHPIKSMTIRTTRNTVIAVLILWLVICVCNSPTFSDFDLVEFGSNVLCVNRKFDPEVDVHYGQIFYGTFFLFGFFLPLMFVIVLYALMVHRLLKLGKTLKQQKERRKASSSGGAKNPSGSENMRAKKRVTRMVVIVVSAFAVCWFPVHVMFLTQFFVTNNIDSNFICIRIFTNCLAYTNSCLNPILYAFLSENFRSNFRRLCLVCLLRRQVKEVRGTCIERTDNRISRKPRAADLYERTTVANITTIADAPIATSVSNKKKFFNRTVLKSLVKKDRETKAYQMAELLTNGGNKLNEQEKNKLPDDDDDDDDAGREQI